MCCRPLRARSHVLGRFLSAGPGPFLVRCKIDTSNQYKILWTFGWTKIEDHYSFKGKTPPLLATFSLSWASRWEWGRGCAAWPLVKVGMEEVDVGADSHANFVEGERGHICLCHSCLLLYLIFLSCFFHSFIFHRE
jgi:hypothetical protein